MIEKKRRGEALPKSHCPKCQNPAKYLEARRITETTKELYFQCQNWKCSIRFVDQQTTVRIIQNKKLSSEVFPISQPDDDLKNLAA